MSKAQNKSLLPNGKEGLFSIEILHFDLSDPKLRKLVSRDSEKKLCQLNQLLNRYREVFCSERNLVWAHIKKAAEDAGVPLDERYLVSRYPICSIDLSIDNYLRLEAYKSRRAVLKYLADALNVYVTASASFYLDQAISESELHFRFECFLSGAGLTSSLYEPLIRAGHSRTGKATQERIDEASKRKERALSMRDELKTRHPNASDSHLAGLIARELQVSKKTIQNYFSSTNRSS